MQKNTLYIERAHLSGGKMIEKNKVLWALGKELLKNKRVDIGEFAEKYKFSRSSINNRVCHIGEKKLRRIKVGRQYKFIELIEGIEIVMVDNLKQG